MVDLGSSGGSGPMGVCGLDQKDLRDVRGPGVTCSLASESPEWRRLRNLLPARKKKKAN